MDYKGNILFGYSRVSTDEQIKKDNSIPMQRKLGERITKEYGFDDFVNFNEGSISGTTYPLQRPKFSELYELIEKGDVKYLYVWEWTRLSRDNYHSAWLRHKFVEFDIKIWEGDTDKPKDLNDPHDKLVSSIISSISTFERENLVKRIKSGIQEAYSKGKWSGNNTPYGYRKNEDGIVIPDEEESEIYSKMVDFVFEGKSIREITNWLNEKNIPTKSSKVIDKGFIKRKKNGKTNKVNVNRMMWRDQVVSSILKSELQKGVRKSKSRDEEYDFPKIISPREWDKLQKKIQDNKRFNHKGNKTKHFYLLKGLLYCRNHDELLLGRIKKDERTYYCSRKRKEVRLKGEPPCPLPSPNLDYLEKVVWEIFVMVMSDSHIIREEYKKKYLGEKSILSNKEEMSKKIMKKKYKINEIDKKRDKLIALHLEETITKNEQVKHLNKLKEEMEEVVEELESLELNYQLIANEKTWIDWVDKFKKEVKRWNSMKISPKEKREKLLKYLTRITVDYKKESYILDFNFKVPMVNDKFVFNDPDNRKKGGYRVEEGKKNIIFPIPKIPTTNQIYPVTGCTGRRGEYPDAGRDLNGTQWYSLFR